MWLIELILFTDGQQKLSFPNGTTESDQWERAAPSPQESWGTNNWPCFADCLSGLGSSGLVEVPYRNTQSQLFTHLDMFSLCVSDKASVLGGKGLKVGSYEHNSMHNAGTL